VATKSTQEWLNGEFIICRLWYSARDVSSADAAICWDGSSAGPAATDATILHAADAGTANADADAGAMDRQTCCHLFWEGPSLQIVKICGILVEQRLTVYMSESAVQQQQQMGMGGYGGAPIDQGQQQQPFVGMSNGAPAGPAAFPTYKGSLASKPDQLAAKKESTFDFVGVSIKLLYHTCLYLSHFFLCFT